MNNNEHSITPPPALFKQWEDDILNDRENVDVVLDCAWKDGYRAGAEAELDACCKWTEANNPGYWDAHKALRAARRPKTPSLKERALALLSRRMDTGLVQELDDDQIDTIRRALYELPDD